MHVRRALGFLLLSFMCAPAAASAQDAGKIGVTMGYPASIGLLWNVSNTLAIRPEFGFAHSSVTSPASTSSASGSSVDTGASVLFYLSRKDNLRPYVTPRVGYAHSSDDLTSTNTWSVSGLVGAQYNLGTRFAVFGETGITYGQVKSSFTSTLPPIPVSLDRTSNVIGTTAGVGVIVYF